MNEVCHGQKHASSRMADERRIELRTTFLFPFSRGLLFIIIIIIITITMIIIWWPNLNQALIQRSSGWVPSIPETSLPYSWETELLPWKLTISLWVRIGGNNCSPIFWSTACSSKKAATNLSQHDSRARNNVLHIHGAWEYIPSRSVVLNVIGDFLSFQSCRSQKVNSNSCSGSNSPPHARQDFAPVRFIVLVIFLCRINSLFNGFPSWDSTWIIYVTVGFTLLHCPQTLFVA